jgi:hypothetical protein
MQKVDLYPIISTGSFYDGLINLNKIFRIAGAIVLINVACFEFGRPPNFPKWPRQSTETTPPYWSDIPYWESLWWTCCSISNVPSVFNDVAEIIPIMVIFPHTAVLHDAPERIILS